MLIRRCSVCKLDCLSKPEWLQHLTLSKHQLRARHLIENYRDVEQISKQSCLVVYSSFQVTLGLGGTADKIISYFSAGVTNCVTGFWCREEDQPKVALLEFESSEKADQLIGAIPGNSGGRCCILIDGQQVEVKRAGDLQDFEWNDLIRLSTENIEVTRKRPLPPSQEDISKQVPVKTRKLDPQKTEMPIGRAGPLQVVSHLKNYAKQRGWPAPQYRFKRKDKSTNFLDWTCFLILNDVEYSIPNTGSNNSRNQCEIQAALLCQNELIANFWRDKETSLDARPNSFALESKHWSMFTEPKSPQHQFWKVYKSVLTPKSTYQLILDITFRLKSLFKEEYPGIEVALIRNSHLGLFSHWTPKDLFFYVHTETPHFAPVSDATINQVMTEKDFVTSASVKALGTRFCHKGSGTQFTLVTKSQYFQEVQLSRLAEYMMSFDKRSHSLLALTYYWSKVNGVSFGHANMLSYLRTQAILPEPMATEWLVIHFMCHEGIIPSVREIQERSSGPKSRKMYLGVNIGFDEDPGFVREWRSSRPELIPEQGTQQFVWNVLQLFQNFLQFYGEKLAGQNWILNTRDGDNVSVSHFLSSDVRPSPLLPRMTNSELDVLKLMQNPGTIPNWELPKVHRNVKRVNFQRRDIHLLHPLILTWRFTVNSRYPAVMNLAVHSARKLERFLQQRNTEENVELEENRIKRLLKVGRKTRMELGVFQC